VYLKKPMSGDACVAGLVKRLPSAQVRSQGPGFEPRVWLPAQRGVCFSLCPSPGRVLTLSLSQIKKKREHLNSTWTSGILS